MDRASSKGIDEGSLTKGQVRKLHALRKSVRVEIGERTFAAWLASHGLIPSTFRPMPRRLIKRLRRA